MDTLPSELLEKIFLIVDGISFIRLRRTCRRFNSLIDKIEIGQKPSVWCRNTYNDFPLPCIESALPWLRNDADRFENDTLIWKAAYACLFESRLEEHTFTCKELFIQGVPTATELSFIGQQLIFSSSMVKECGGLRSDQSKNCKLLPVTALRFHQDTRKQSLDFYCLEPFKPNDNVVFKPLNIGDKSSLFVLYCKEMVHTFLTEETDKSFLSMYRFRSNLNHEDDMRPAVPSQIEDIISLSRWDHVCHGPGIFLTTKEKKLKVFQVSPSSSKEPEPSVIAELPLPQPVRCMRLIGTLLVSLFSNKGDLWTKTVKYEEAGKVSYSSWKKLKMFKDVSPDFALDSVMDFDTAGLAFVALTSLGKVYLSHLQEVSHDCLQHNLFLACEVTLSSPNHHQALDKVRVDINDGVSIAVYGHAYGLTLFFLAKGSPT